MEAILNHAFFEGYESADEKYLIENIDRFTQDKHIQFFKKTKQNQAYKPAKIAPVFTMLDDSTGYLSIPSFDFYGAEKELTDSIYNALFDVNELKVKKLILDLRGNTGGSLNMINAVLGQFVGNIYLHYDVQSRSKTTKQKSKNYSSFTYNKSLQEIYILVDQKTNSGTAIFSNVMHYHFNNLENQTISVKIAGLKPQLNNYLYNLIDLSIPAGDYSKNKSLRGKFTTMIPMGIIHMPGGIKALDPDLPVACSETVDIDFNDDLDVLKQELRNDALLQLVM